MKHKISALGILFFCFCIPFLNAQKITISGNATDYAETTLSLYGYKDLITMQEEELVSFRIDEGGDFSASFILDQIEFVYFNLGAYKAYFFAEPGKTYELVLPERKEKTKAQLLNPFFEEEFLHLGILNVDSSQLNYQIAVFDNLFNQELIVALEALKTQTNLSLIDTAISNLSSTFSYSKHAYFKAYKTYKIALINLIVSNYKAKEATQTQIVNKPVLYNNTSYMEVFQYIFKNYFIYHARSEEGKALIDYIFQGSLSKVKNNLNHNDLIKNDTIKELVLLKSLYDEFFSDRFSRSAMLQLLDSLYFTSAIPEHKVIAQNIREEVTKLLQGFYPPEFKLKDKKGKLHNLREYRGKYVYLNFVHTQSYTSLKDFELLEKIYEKYHREVEIISICIDDDPKDVWYFQELKNYKWTFLHYSNDPKVIKEYDIRAFPTYYLIGRDGKLKRSPANGPSEKFEIDLNTILRDEERKQRYGN